MFVIIRVVTGLPFDLQKLDSFCCTLPCFFKLFPPCGAPNTLTESFREGLLRLAFPFRFSGIMEYAGISFGFLSKSSCLAGIPRLHIGPIEEEPSCLPCPRELSCKALFADACCPFVLGRSCFCWVHLLRMSKFSNMGSAIPSPWVILPSSHAPWAQQVQALS